MTNTEDLVTRALNELPPIAVNDVHAERVRRAALRELSGSRPRLRLVRRAEPYIAYGVAAAYLFWAFQVIIG